MMFFSSFLVAFVATQAAAQLPNSWWSLALAKDSEISHPDGTLKALNCSKFASILPPHVMEECRMNAYVLSAVTKGVRRALYICQTLFRHNKWTCTTFTHQYLLGRAVETKACREREFVRTLLAAAITYDIANECRERHIPNCPCDFSVPFITRTENQTIIGGCGAHFDHASGLTRKVMTVAPTGRSTDLVVEHNINAGTILANNTAIACRCHGPTGSCSLKTCYRKISPITAKSNDVLLKYSGAVLVHQLGGELVPNNSRVATLRVTDVAFTDPSPDFCVKAEGVLGTAGRECDPTNISALNSCYQLCCGRGHHVRTDHVKKKKCLLRTTNGVPRLECTTETVVQTKHFCN